MNVKVVFFIFLYLVTVPDVFFHVLLHFCLLINDNLLDIFQICDYHAWCNSRYKWILSWFILVHFSTDVDNFPVHMMSHLCKSYKNWNIAKSLKKFLKEYFLSNLFLNPSVFQPFFFQNSLSNHLIINSFKIISNCFVHYPNSQLYPVLCSSKIILFLAHFEYNFTIIIISLVSVSWKYIYTVIKPYWKTCYIFLCNKFIIFF